MNLFEGVPMAISSLWAHKFRTFLTTLGILIGVASVIVMIALGTGMREKSVKDIEDQGANLIEIMKDWNYKEKETALGRGSPGLTTGDLEEIRLLPFVGAISPENGMSSRFRYRELDIMGATQAVGSDFFKIKPVPLAAGRFFSADEEANGEKVAVLTPKLWKKLFQNENPIGKTVRVDTDVYTIVGAIGDKPPTKGGGMHFSFGRENLVLYIPYRRGLDPKERPDRIDQVIVSARSRGDLASAKQEITRILERRHGVKDFRMFVYEELLIQIEAQIAIFSMVLLLLGAISLVVGGIGVMNIMLATVSERTREIGIRRAIGARRRDVLFQFLVESATLSLLGGVLGIALGIGVAYAIDKYTELTTVVTVGSIVLSSGVSLAVGVLFGLYPAYAAAMKDPIESLRYE